MIDKETNSIFCDFFSKDIRDDFLFPFDTYRLFLEGLSINPLLFFDKWSDTNMQSVIEKYWKQNTNADWKADHLSSRHVKPLFLALRSSQTLIKLIVPITAKRSLIPN